MVCSLVSLPRLGDCFDFFWMISHSFWTDSELGCLSLFLPFKQWPPVYEARRGLRLRPAVFEVRGPCPACRVVPSWWQVAGTGTRNIHHPYRRPDRNGRRHTVSFVQSYRFFKVPSSGPDAILAVHEAQDSVMLHESGDSRPAGNSKIRNLRHLWPSHCLS